MTVINFTQGLTINNSSGPVDVDLQMGLTINDVIENADASYIQTELEKYYTF